MAKIKKYIKSEFLEELQETLQKQGSFAEKKNLTESSRKKRHKFVIFCSRGRVGSEITPLVCMVMGSIPI